MLPVAARAAAVLLVAGVVAGQLVRKLYMLQYYTQNSAVQNKMIYLVPRLPDCVPVGDEDPHLQHLGGELLLVVAERTLEEVLAGGVSHALYAGPVEPAAAAGSPEHSRPRNLHSTVEYGA